MKRSNLVIFVENHLREHGFDEKSQGIVWYAHSRQGKDLREAYPEFYDCMEEAIRLYHEKTNDNKPLERVFDVFQEVLL